MTANPVPSLEDIEQRLLVGGYAPNVAHDAAHSVGVDDAIRADLDDDTIIRTALRIADKLIDSNRPRYRQPAGE